ncbi:hypothetical protein K456DRAFT_51887 [Colletotrichum gloeosporioides 23]|nr:hypothetical protein K456DRAFT_51887 [Colletotrichum gloeosporioides 23]
MISRAVLARSICLRCQLRLLDRPRALSSDRVAPLRSEFLQRRHYSSPDSAWDRLEADSQTQKEEKDGEKPGRNREQSKVKSGLDEHIGRRQDPAPVEDNIASSSKDENEPPAAKLDGPLLFKKTWQDKGDIRRMSGRVVKLKHAVLPGNALGKVARAVIMRDSNRAVRKLPVEHMAAEEQVNLAADLEKQAQELTEEQSLANIEELRPSDPILYRHEFDELLQNLLKGFTVSQLKAYLLVASKTALKSSERKEQPMYSIIRGTKCEPWAPLRKLKITGSPKERIGLTLLTEAWGLQIREYVDGKGVFSPRIATRFLRMLSREKKRLDAIRRTYLDAEEKILIGQSSIKVIATKAKTDTIMKELEQAAKDTVVQTIDDVFWVPNDDETVTLLEHLGQLTSTLITHRPQEKIIEVAWFRDGPEQRGQERRADVVRRLLLTALWPKEETVHLKGPKDTECRTIPMMIGRERLSWVDKLTQWSRWAKPVGRNSRPKPHISVKQRGVLSKPIEAPPTESEFRERRSKSYTATTASFGHILHKNADAVNMAAAADPSPHIFSPTSPPPASLAALSERLNSSKPVTTSLVLTFRALPSIHESKPEYSIKTQYFTRVQKLEKPSDAVKPSSGPVRRPDLLELQLTIPDDLPEGPLMWDSCPKRLVVVADQTHTDVSIPDQPVDLRISQSDLRVMSASALDDSPFREYIDTAELDLLAGRLGPPPMIRIADTPFNPPIKNPSEPTDYMFTGLEMRRTLEADYRGHKLLYTSVQAGHHGGRRAEMVLEAQPADPSLSPEEQELHAASFLSLAKDLAQGKVVKWVGEVDAEAENQRRLAAAKPVAEPEVSDTSM